MLVAQRMLQPLIKGLMLVGRIGAFLAQHLLRGSCMCQCVLCRLAIQMANAPTMNRGATVALRRFVVGCRHFAAPCPFTTRTHNALGPCTPIVNVRSISAVRLGPVTSEI